MKVTYLEIFLFFPLQCSDKVTGGANIYNPLRMGIWIRVQFTSLPRSICPYLGPQANSLLIYYLSIFSPLLSATPTLLSPLSSASRYSDLSLFQ